MGKPEKNLQHEYRQIVVGPVTIWQAVDVERDEQAPFIEIRLTKFLFLKSMSVRGARAKTSCPLPTKR